MKRLISLTGPSGVGKTTIASGIISRLRRTNMVQSYTTRTRRHNDLPGEYCYISLKEFEQMKEAEKFLWTAEHGGTHYGTTAESIANAFIGDDTLSIMILVPDVIPKLNHFINSIGKKGLHVPIFISSPRQGILESRLSKRGDSETDIALRLSQAHNWEREAIVSLIPYQFVGNEENGVANAVDNIMSIIHS